MTAAIAPDIGISSAAQCLIDSVPAGQVDLEALYRDLPEFLRAALELLLEEIDASPGRASSGAVGCRILAATIARLTD